MGRQNGYWPTAIICDLMFVQYKYGVWLKKKKIRLFKKKMVTKMKMEQTEYGFGNPIEIIMALNKE